MQKLTRKISAALSALILAVALMFSPCPGFFRPVSGSLGGSALLIRAEEQPVTDESKGIAALLTLLFANGIRFVGQWDDVSAGAVKMWNDFTTATGNTVTLAALGAGVAIQHGYMRTSATVNNAVNAFQSWYVNSFSVPSSGDVNIPVGSGGGNGFIVPVLARFGSGANVTYEYDLMSMLENYGFQMAYWNIRSYSGTVGTELNGRFTFLKSNGTYYFMLVRPDSAFDTLPFAYRIDGYGAQANTNSVSRTVNGTTYYILYSGMLFYGDYVTGAVADIAGQNLYEAAVAYTYGDAAINDVSIGGQSYDLKDGYNLNTDQSLLLDIANLAALVASIGLTLDSINDLVQDWPAIFDTPWADTDVPDITFPVPIEDTPDNTIPWVNVPDAVSPDPVPDYVPDSPAGEGEYKVLGLDKVFPFSIPFDLYYLATVLVAEPETPSFTYALYNPKTASLITQEVDLHQFDTIAALLRKLETVLFIAALIFVTRGLIRS